MFAGLRHHTLIGCNDKQRQVDSADARQHILDEITVAGHVNNPNQFAVRQRIKGESQVNRHLAGLFLFEPVRIDPGQCPHERGFAMIDVACGTNHIHASNCSFQETLLDIPSLMTPEQIDDTHVDIYSKSRRRKAITPTARARNVAPSSTSKSRASRSDEL